MQNVELDEFGRCWKKAILERIGEKCMCVCIERAHNLTFALIYSSAYVVM